METIETNKRSVLHSYFAIYDFLKTNFHLIKEMTRQEISHRYSGQVFGNVWAIVHPLVFIGVYIFLFVFVFKMKIGGTTQLPLDYTSYLLSGLIPWLTLQESLNKGSYSIVGHSRLVKQVVFPIEVLPIKMALGCLPAFFISLGIVIIYNFYTYHFLFLTTLLLPLLIVLQVMLMIGWNFILGVFGTFFRDTKDFVQIISFICMYFMPMFYLPEAVPRLFKPILYINPFSYLIWCYQDLMYFGEIRHPSAWIFTSVFSILIIILGVKFFRTAKVAFGDVL